MNSVLIQCKTQWNVDHICLDLPVKNTTEKKHHVYAYNVICKYNIENILPFYATVVIYKFKEYEKINEMNRKYWRAQKIMVMLKNVY